MIIGITDQIVEPGPFEREYMARGAQFKFFNTLDERLFPEKEIAKVDVLFVCRARVSEYTASRLKNCRLVVCYTIGYDQVDGEALARNGIPLANNPAYCTEEVADTEAAMILAVARNIVRHDALAKGYRQGWQENTLPSLRASECNVGLIGLGHIGMATVFRLKPFGFNIFFYDPYAQSGMEKVLGIKRLDRLRDLLAVSDIVSLNCPLTSETEGMIDLDFLDNMREDAALINIARGKILRSLDDLYQHMRNKPKFRAALDVLPQEPPEDHPLLKAWREGAEWLNHRLIINPHNAYYSEDSYKDMHRDALATAWNALKHGRFRNVVNGVR